MNLAARATYFRAILLSFALFFSMLMTGGCGQDAEKPKTDADQKEASAAPEVHSEGSTDSETQSEERASEGAGHADEKASEGGEHGEGGVPKGSTQSGGELEQDRQGAHDISPEQKHEAILQVLDDFLQIEKISDPSKTNDLSIPLAKQALTSAEETLKQDQELGRIKHRKFQDIKLKFRNFTGGVSGIAVEYTDYSYYTDAKSGQIIIPVKPTIQRYSVASQQLDGRWKIVMFLEPTRKPPAEDIKQSTTTLPEVVEEVQEKTGYQ